MTAAKMSGGGRPIGMAIVDQTTSPSRRIEIAVELADLERYVGRRAVVRVRIDDDGEPTSRSIDLEPEQARRLAHLLEQASDVADKAPVRIVRDLIAQLEYAENTGDRVRPDLASARAWLARNGDES
jgi:hypothetical protein